MAHLRHHSVRRAILAGLTGVLAFPVVAAVVPTSAQAATSPTDIPVVGGFVDSAIGIVNGAAAGISGALGGFLP
ncbi:MAG TPA: hypothetical protein VFV02_02020 [Acidimicrobiales bacterium]|nr:hypothetical protein [Acidimicrobiales bacterium]